MIYYSSYLNNNSIHNNLNLLFVLLNQPPNAYLDNEYQIEIKYMEDLLYIYNKYKNYKFCNNDFKSISLYNYFNSNDITPLSTQNVILIIFEVIYIKLRLILIVRKKEYCTNYNILYDYINELINIFNNFQTTKYGLFLFEIYKEFK
jgi:hypothetical protein